MSAPRYHLKKLIGRGGMGTVWEAQRVGPDGVMSKVAIKVLHGQHALGDGREHLLNEAQILTLLSSARIVRMIETTEIRKAPALVMEWIDGVSLRELIVNAAEADSPRLGLTAACFIVGEILEALGIAHTFKIGGEDAGVIHYDLKPANILVSSSGEVKLTDFGISKLAALTRTMSHSQGTPDYMAPEQLEGRASRASDIFSLGVVFHELLDGARYWGELTSQQRALKFLSGEIAPLLSDDLPEWADALRRSMLAHDTTKRPTAREAQDVIFSNAPDYMRGPETLRTLYGTFVGQGRSGWTGVIPTATTPSPEQIRTLALEPEEGAPREWMRQRPVRLEDASHGATGSLGAHQPPTTREADVTPPPAVAGPQVDVEARPASSAIEPGFPATQRLPLSFAQPLQLQQHARGESTPELRPPPELADAPVRASDVPDGLPPPDRPQSTPALAVGSSKERRRYWPLVAGGVAVAVAGTLAVIAVARAGRDEPSSARDEVAVAQPRVDSLPDSDVDLGGPPPSRELAPAHSEKIEAETERPPEPEPDLPPPPAPEHVEVVEPVQPKSAPRPKKPRPQKVEVTFQVKGVRDPVEVRVGSRRLSFARVKVHKLAPGTYPVKWRLDGEDSWHDVGSLKVTALGKGGYVLAVLTESGLQATEHQP